MEPIELRLEDPLKPTVVNQDIKLPCQGDVDELLVVVVDEAVPDGLLYAVPKQFTATFNGGETGTVLIPVSRRDDNNEYRISLKDKVLRDIIRIIRGVDTIHSDIDPITEPVSVPYEINGRFLGGKWLVYARGLVVFTCGVEEDRSEQRGAPEPKSTGVEKMQEPIHKFDHGIEKPGKGGFGRDFLSTRETYRSRNKEA